VDAYPIQLCPCPPKFGVVSALNSTNQIEHGSVESEAGSGGCLGA
jgi:hypothetical protein